MRTIIFGKDSNLTKTILKKDKSCISFSSRNVVSGDRSFINYKNEKVNLLLNNFQTSSKLNNLSSPEKFINNSILSTAQILEEVNQLNVNKIIYVSSSSVYANNSYASENDKLEPSSLYSALKIANEILIAKFCEINNYDYTIARVFNMYGGFDRFSVIHKIIDSAKHNKIFHMANNGSGIRDFIHVDDVASIVMKLFNHQNISHINIGSGVGISVKEIVSLLGERLNKNLKVKNIATNEISVSIADITLLKNTIKCNKFVNLHEYLLGEVNG